MFVLRRLLLLVLIGVAVYVFWPRTSSMTRFEPEAMAEIQMTIWKAAASKQPQGPILPLYHLYQDQYHVPPISSLKMAFDMSRALRLFSTSPDAADQEKALLPLQTVFATLKSNTQAGFDANAAARMELMNWMLRADHAKRAQLTASWSDFLGLLYGQSAEACLPAAKKFSIASKLAEEGKWADAQASSLEGWQVIKSLAPPEK